MIHLYTTYDMCLESQHLGEDKTVTSQGHLWLRSSVSPAWVTTYAPLKPCTSKPADSRWRIVNPDHGPQRRLCSCSLSAHTADCIKEPGSKSDALTKAGSASSSCVAAKVGNSQLLLKLHLTGMNFEKHPMPWGRAAHTCNPSAQETETGGQ